MLAIFYVTGGNFVLDVFIQSDKQKNTVKLERKRVWRQTHYQNMDEFGWILLRLGLSKFNCQRWIFWKQISSMGFLLKFGRPTEAPQEHIRWFRSQHKEACECPGEKQAKERHIDRWLGYGAWIRAKIRWNSVEFKHRNLLFFSRRKAESKDSTKDSCGSFWIRHVEMQKETGKDANLICAESWCFWQDAHTQKQSKTCTSLICSHTRPSTWSDFIMFFALMGTSPPQCPRWNRIRKWRQQKKVYLSEISKTPKFQRKSSSDEFWSLNLMLNPKIPNLLEAVELHSINLMKCSPQQASSAASNELLTRYSSGKTRRVVSHIQYKVKTLLPTGIHG